MALARPPAERPAFLAGACGADRELALEVDSLLEAHDQAGAFIETPVLGSAGASSFLDELEQPPTWTGRRVGAYSLGREIGHGGMGAVYLAVRADDEYRKEVAVKVVRSSFEPAFVQQRFRRERQILANLDHPNIARLIDGGSTEDGTPYFVMEYVDGLPIDRYCAAGGLPVERRLALFGHVCAAVHYAHQRLVVHRDLKPNNILVTADGTPKLLDFGIAKLLDPEADAPQDTFTAMRVMTFESASPEQVRGEIVTTATDVYSLGVLLYRLLTGLGPFDGATTTSHELARAICEDDPRRPSEVTRDAVLARRLRGDLDTIVMKALQKDPVRRYASVEQFGEDVARHLAARPVAAQPDTIRYRTAKFVARHKAGVAAAALVILSLVGTVTAAAWEAHVARLERSRAERRFNDVRRLANSFLFEFHDAIDDLPGSTKARELVVLRATEYLDSLASESGNDASLTRELAAAYDKVGDVQGLPQFANLGDTAGALRSHRRALELRTSLAASSTDAGIQRELATTHRHLTGILAVMKEHRAAMEHARKGLAIDEALLARSPGGVDERRSLAARYQDIGELLSVTGDRRGALDNFRREAEVFEALLAEDPASSRAQRDAAIGYRKLGAVLEANGDRATAVAIYRKAVVLDEARVAANGTDASARLDLSYGYASIGLALSKMGDTAGSLEQYQRALELRAGVSAADPHDVNARDAVGRAHLSIGQVLRNVGRYVEAIQHFRQALEIASARYAADPTNGSAGERLTNAYGALAGAGAGLAAATADAADAARRWRETREWTLKSIDIWTVRRGQGVLSASGKHELDSLVALAEKCDLELTRLAAARRR